MSKKLFADAQPPAVLSADEVSAVEAEVRAELEAEEKAKERARLKQRLKDEAAVKAAQEDGEMVEVSVDLAPYCDRILINNVAYLQGQTYTVSVGKAQVMREIMQKTWNHQAEIDGKSENFYRRARGSRVTPSNVTAPAGQILRA